MNCTTERPGTEVFVQKMCKVSWQSCVHVLLTFCAQSGVHQLCPLKSILLAPIHLLSTFLADPFVCKWANGQVGKWASGQVGKWASGQVGKWLVHGSHHFAQSQFAILSPRTPHSSRPCTLSLPSPLSNPFVTTFPAGHCRLCSAECRHSWVVDAFKHILKILRADVVLKAYYPALCVGICCSV